jgi:hypothetical protein
MGRTLRSFFPSPVGPLGQQLRFSDGAEMGFGDDNNTSPLADEWAEHVVPSSLLPPLGVGPSGQQLRFSDGAINDNTSPLAERWAEHSVPSVLENLFANSESAKTHMVSAITGMPPAEAAYHLEMARGDSVAAIGLYIDMHTRRHVQAQGKEKGSEGDQDDALRGQDSEDGDEGAWAGAPATREHITRI